jgi:hypothetical protein
MKKSSSNLRVGYWFLLVLLFFFDCIEIYATTNETYGQGTSPDNMVSSLDTSGTYSTSSYLYIGDSGDSNSRVTRAYVEFDLSNIASITNAVFYGYLDDYGVDPIDIKVNLYYVNDNTYTYSESSVSWSSGQPCGTTVGSLNSDCTYIDSFVVSGSFSPYTVNVTSAAQYVINNFDSKKMVLVFYNDTTPSGKWATLISREFSSPTSWRPYLNMTYTSFVLFSNYAKDKTPNEDQDVTLNVTLDQTPNEVKLEWQDTTNYTVTTNNSLEYYFTINSGNYTAHDTKTFYWYASNTNNVWSKSTQQSFTVANQVPTVAQGTVNDTAPYTNDHLLCNNGAFSDNDAEDSEQNREYKWYDGDSEVSGETSQTLLLSVAGLDKTDVIKCSQRVYDNYDWSSWANSSTSATIQNTAPIDPTDISGFPANLYVTNTLTVSATGSSDADGDGITHHFKFYNIDDAGTVQDWSSDTSYVIQTSDAHDTIRVYAKSTTSDANSTGSYSEDDIVENTAPVIISTRQQVKFPMPPQNRK